MVLYFMGKKGHKHSEETKRKISESVRKARARECEKTKELRILKYVITSSKNGTLVPKSNSTKKGWRHGKRTIGGQTKHFRSRWEANYARILQFYKDSGQILDWEFEPDTFWFDGIKRGTVSYLPDFKVFRITGGVYYVEVKGWMDAKSKTKLKRMAKYHPNVELHLVDSKEYKKLEKEWKDKLDDWELL